MSATQSWFGPVAVNDLPTRSGRVSGAGPGHRGPRPLGPAPAQPTRAHQPFDGAPGHLVALPVQLGVHLAGPVDPVVIRVHPPDRLTVRRVGLRPSRRWARLGRVVGAREAICRTLQIGSTPRRSLWASM